MRRPHTRRRFLEGTAAAGLLATAGCLSKIGNAETNAATGETGAYTPASEIEPPESVDEWLDTANGYMGDRVRDGIGSPAEVQVGHEYEDDGLGFAPVVIEVPPKTVVHWDWTGHGGQHNVVALDGTFDSGRTNAQPGTGYHYFFEETGTYPYVSEPHRDDGMKGVVVVTEPPSTGYEDVDKWVVHSSNFDGEITDRTDADSASITVGAEGNGGSLAFAPVVLRITPDTNVTWEWSDQAGPANVSFKNADIKSGGPTPDPETTFEHTFEETGIYRYSSLPHESLGMRGAIIVEE